MSEAKCKGGDCGVATYDQTAEHDAHYKADADTWRSDTPLFCSLECPQREALERALKGKPIESPAAPVERARLRPVDNSGWVTDMGNWITPCVLCGATSTWFHYVHKGRCDACAPTATGFAAPAPTVAIIDECDETEYRMTGTNSDWVKWTAEPTPNPAPRCEFTLATGEQHGGAVLLRKSKWDAGLVCDSCWLRREARVADKQAEADIGRSVKPADNRPRATVGVVPQVFGLSVGILSRGMR